MTVVSRWEAVGAADLPFAKRTFHYVVVAGELFRFRTCHCAPIPAACNTLHSGLYRSQVLRFSAGKEMHWSGKYRRSQLAWGNSNALE